MMEECAVLLVAPRIDANNGAPRLQRRNICVQCEEASADSMKLLQFPTDEAKWKHAWEHVRLTYSVATEPNPSVEAIKNNSRCKAFFHEKCFPLKKVPQPQVHRKRSCVGDIEGAIRPVASNTAKRLNSLDHDWPLQEKSFNILKDIAPTANGICSNTRKCEACDREIEQAADIRDRHVWHHLNKVRETADRQIQPPLPRFRCSVGMGENGLRCDWGTYVMVHMESHWREHHPDIAISQDTPPVLDLSANLRHPFEQMNLICFPPIILQHSIPSPQSECTATCSPQRAIDSLIAGDSRQRLVTEDEEAIPIEEDESNTASPPMSTDDRPSFYSRATVSRTCKECQVDHFDAAEHCATRHARSFPFRCGDDQCGESFSSIIRFIKHAAVLHGKQPNNSSTISLIVNKTRLKTLEASIAHCFGHLELDDIDL